MELHAVRLRRGAAGTLLVGCLFGWTGVAVGLTGTVRLSWSPDEQVTEAAWPAATNASAPGAASGEEVILDVYMTVDVDAPLDSLGFFLRWSAEGEDGSLRLLDLRKAAGDAEFPFQIKPAPAEAADAWFTPLGGATVAEFLGRVAEPAEGGITRYPLRLRLAATGGPRLRIQTYGVAAMAKGQAPVHLGSPAIATSKGWTLKFVPTITEVRGMMNRSFLFSDLAILGIDLEHVARLIIIDSEGRRVAPNVINSRLSERIDVTMANKIVAEGLCGVEIMNGDGLRSACSDAIQAISLRCRRPGDTSKGVIHTSDDWEDCK